MSGITQLSIVSLSLGLYYDYDLDGSSSTKGFRLDGALTSILKKETVSRWAPRGLCICNEHHQHGFGAETGISGRFQSRVHTGQWKVIHGESPFGTTTTGYMTVYDTQAANSL